MNVEDGTVSPCLRECAARAHEPILVFEACGDGEGGIVPTLVGDHENRVTYRTAIVVGVDMYNQCTTGGGGDDFEGRKSRQSAYTYRDLQLKWGVSR